MNNNFPVISLNNSRWLHSPANINNIVRPYDVPTRDDLAVCLCYFSYCRYKKPLANLLAVLQDLRQAHIPHYVIELLYPNQTSVVPNPHKVVHAQTVMFHKENLYNVLVPHIPAQYSKLLFLDADIRFTTPDWYDQTSRVLDDVTIMQPMDVASWVWFCKHSIAHVALRCDSTSINLMYHHPGFATGIRRDLFNQLGGLYDKAVIGSGDTLFWNAILRALDLLPEAKRPHASHIQYYTGVSEYHEKCIVNKNLIKIGVVSFNTAIHMSHGLIQNRKYSNRIQDWQMEPCNLYKNDDGVYEWSNPKYDKYMREYFVSREEDA